MNKTAPAKHPITHFLLFLSTICDFCLLVLALILLGMIFWRNGFRHGIWAALIVGMAAGCIRFVMGLIFTFLIWLLDRRFPAE